KGVAAVMLMRLVTDDYFWIGLAAIAAIVGHILPVFLRFRGGKGVATGVGVYLALAPYSVLATLVLWALIVYFTRYVSLGSIIATSAVPLWTLLFYGWLFPSPHLEALVIIAIVGCALIRTKHHENIRRLMRGNENKIGTRLKPSSPEVGSSSAEVTGGRS